MMLSQRSRRFIVLLSYLLTSLLIINYGLSQRDMEWTWVSEANFFIIFALLLLRCVLGWSVAEITGLFSKHPDERQLAQRNRVYAISYKALLLMIPLLSVGWLIWGDFNKYPVAWFMPDINNPPWVGYADQVGNFLQSFFDFILFLPIHIIAWLEPDPIQDELFEGEPINAR